jgi:hypothetical protein
VALRRDLTDCRKTELAISLAADGRQARASKGALWAHLRTCSDCAGFLQDVWAQRAVWNELARLPVPVRLRALENSGASLPQGRHLNQ